MVTEKSKKIGGRFLCLFGLKIQIGLKGFVDLGKRLPRKIDLHRDLCDLVCLLSDDPGEVLVLLSRLPAPRLK